MPRSICSSARSAGSFGGFFVAPGFVPPICTGTVVKAISGNPDRSYYGPASYETSFEARFYAEEPVIGRCYRPDAPVSLT